MNFQTSLSLLLVALVASINGLPVPDSSSTSTTSSESPSVFADKGPKKTNVVRSINTGDNLQQQLQDPSLMITRALEDVSNTLGGSLRNIGKSAIQILEGTSVGVEQALGTGARIITGVAETVGEAAETGSKGAIRIAQGVAKSLSSGTKSLVDTKVGLLQGLTGSQIQADASTNAESVQRNERAPQTGFGGYAGGGYGGNQVAETPGNFVNVFSQAAANTVNFGTQLLNSLVGVAANILQAATSFGSTLARTFGDTFGGLFQRINQAGSDASVSGGSGAIGGRLGLSGLSGLSGLGGGSGGGLGTLLSALSSLGGGASSSRDSSSGTGNLLGGLGNFAQTLINAKLNLLNGILSPFTGGRPLLNFGRLNTASSSSSSLSTSASSNSGSSGFANAATSSEPTFRISIAGASSASPSSTTSAASSTTDSDTNNPRVARFYANPDVLAPVKVNAELTDANLRATFKNGVIKGLVDTLNSNLDRLGLRPTGSKTDLVGSFDSSSSFAVKTPIVSSTAQKETKKEKSTSSTASTPVKTDEQLKNSFSQILPLAFSHQIGQLQQQQQQQPKVLAPATKRQQRRIQAAKKTQ